MHGTPRKDSPSIENYLETIYEISNGEGDVRLTDIANLLEVSKASVNRAMGQLRERGYVDQRPYSGISLTELGLTKAKDIRRRHELWFKFLTEFLGADESIADVDACRMEHVVSSHSMGKLERWLETQDEKKNVQ